MGTLTDAQVNTMHDTAFLIRGRAVTYRVPATDSTNTRTGVISRTWTDTALTAVLIGPISTGGTRQRRVRIKVDDIPAFPPEKTHRITIDGDDWNVVSHRENQTTHVTSILVEKP